MGSLEEGLNTLRNESEAREQELRASYDQQISEMSSGFQGQLDSVRSSLSADYEKQLSDLRSQYDASTQQDRSGLADQIAAIRAQYESDLAGQRQAGTQSADGSSLTGGSTASSPIDSGELDAFRAWQEDDASYGLQTLRGGGNGGGSVISGASGNLASGGQAYYGGRYGAAGDGEDEPMDGTDSWSRSTRYARQYRGGNSLAAGSRSSRNAIGLSSGNTASGYYASRFRR